jgi:hypothetical protein
MVWTGSRSTPLFSDAIFGLPSIAGLRHAMKGKNDHHEYKIIRRTS